uniref:DUF4303 domain-containing protein n=1 Tax=Thaumasiovibrio occultus TaxID=1891184 RepID=UPI000B3614D4|nr:DUF4303 domain-containing protein [Thaumasiovibrio occultus]
MDFKKLKAKIVRAGRVAFPKIRANHPNETFYFFGLYTSGEYSYLSPTCSTYQGLKDVAEQYQKDDYYKDKSLEYLMDDLKWSPCDSPLHLEAEEEFDCLESEMRKLSEELDSLYNPTDWRAFNAFVNDIENCMIEALSELDSMGVFGTGEVRSQVLVNLVMGDQSDEDRIRFAQRLNSPEQVASLRDEMEA